LKGTVTGVAVDAGGDVYISNFENIGIYTRETKKLVRTIDRNLYRPIIPVVAPDGTLDVMDKVGVAIFPDAQQARMKRIETKDAFAIAVDAQSNLYVAPNGQNSILVYPPNSTTLSRTITEGIATPVAMAFDSGGNMYVANGAGGGQCGNSSNGGTVTVYAPNANSPSYTITTGEGLCGPSAFAFDASGNLYVANFDKGNEFAGSITVYSAGTATLLRTITDGVSAPRSVAIDAAGKLYVANTSIKPNGGNVTVYASGSGKLLQTISDGKRAAPLQVVIGK
jgi:sugar lactone lactonase YvrE